MRGIYAPTFLLALAHVRRLTPPRLAVPTPPPPADDYTTTAWEAAAPPSCKPPSGARVIVSPSVRGLVLFRTLSPDEARLAQWQAEYQKPQRCEPLR